MQMTAVLLSYVFVHRTAPGMDIFSCFKEKFSHIKNSINCYTLKYNACYIHIKKNLQSFKFLGTIHEKYNTKMQCPLKMLLFYYLQWYQGASEHMSMQGLTKIH